MPRHSRSSLVALVLVLSACARSGLDVDETSLVDAGSGRAVGAAGSAGTAGGGGSAGSAGKGGAGSGGAGSGGAGSAGASGAGSAGSPADAGLDADAAVDAAVDATVDAAVDATVDAPPDVVTEDAPPECTSDDACDDGVACTKDTCSPAQTCVHAPVDQACDDGVFCTGKETCDVALGCVTTPLDCSDPIGCTQDTCDEATQACTHTPDDASCPISHKCGVDEGGCYALAYAHTETELLEIRLPSGVAKPIGKLGVQMTDVALHPDGTLYGFSFNGLYTIDSMTGQAKLSKTLNAGQMVAMDAAPDGTIYAGGGSTMFVLDPGAGALTPIAPFPPGLLASGDIAFLSGSLFASAKTQGKPDLLVLFDAGKPTVIGSIGFECVWGLAAFGTTLYGLTCNGEVIVIDPQTGAGTLVSSTPYAFWGASAR